MSKKLQELWHVAMESDINADFFPKPVDGVTYMDPKTNPLADEWEKFTHTINGFGILSFRFKGVLLVGCPFRNTNDGPIYYSPAYFTEE